MENENEGKKRTNLRWQHDFLPLDDFSDVQIKKVAVQNGLCRFHILNFFRRPKIKFWFKIFAKIFQSQRWDLMIKLNIKRSWTTPETIAIQSVWFSK